MLAREMFSGLGTKIVSDFLGSWHGLSSFIGHFDRFAILRKPSKKRAFLKSAMVGHGRVSGRL